MSREGLAKAMRDRRSQLGLTVVDVVGASGVARSTWRELEEGHRSRLTAPVGVKIDSALGWAPGTSSEIFEGSGEPPPADSDGIVSLEQRIGAIVASQMTAVRAQLSTPAAVPTGFDALLDVWLRLKPLDQDCALRMLRGLEALAALSAS